MLRLLLVEDSPTDAERVLRALRPLGPTLEHRRVADPGQLRTALAEFAPDVILSDFALPGFSGLDALTTAIELAPDTPFIFVSATIGDDLAADTLRRGAADYVLKNHLQRLPAAVERALDNSRQRVERQRMRRELRSSEARNRAIIATALDGFITIDADGMVVEWTAQTEAIFGWAREEALGRRLSELIIPEQYRQAHENGLRHYMATGEGPVLDHRFEIYGLHRSGREFPLELAIWPLRDGDGVTFNAFVRDISDRRQAEERIRQLARLHAVLSALGSAVMRADTRQGVLDAVCRVAVEQGGFKAVAITGPDDAGKVRLLSRGGDPHLLQQLAEIGERAQGIVDPAQWSPGVRALRNGARTIIPDLATDTTLPEWIRLRMREANVAAQAVLPVGSPVWGVLGVYATAPQAFDADEVALFERLAEEIDFAIDFIAKSERLEYLAYHNPVSGLPNRTALHTRLQPRLRSEPVLLALARIENFAEINESRSRAFADALLCQAGKRLSELCANCEVSHLESATFALSWSSTGTLEAEMERLAGLLLSFQADPFVIDGQQIRIDLHAGVAISPGHGDNAETLEHAAAAALQESDRRKLRVLAFSDELRGRAARRLTLEHELRVALDEQQFVLFYQPKFQAATQRLVGAEALLRWRHPQRGLVSPAEFIPALEDSGLIVPVGLWVMREALDTALAWREHMPDFRIAVNVSARELGESRFLEECRLMLEPHGADNPLDIEITESLLMADIDHSMYLLAALRRLGCRVSIDDFGTGYSSLNYLARLPADELKIDISFIALLTHSPETMSLVTNIISLAHSLSLKVVAEGVEEEEQAKLLRLLRCDVLQGYLLGRPMPAEQFAIQCLGIDAAAERSGAAVPHLKQPSG